MWLRVWELCVGSYRFFFPERAAWQGMIAGYQQALIDEKVNSEAREKELKGDLATLKRKAERSERAESHCREQLTQMQRQIWQLSAVIHATDAVKRLREDPEFQKHTVEQVELLMKLKEEGEAAGEDPPG